MIDPTPHVASRHIAWIALAVVALAGCSSGKPTAAPDDRQAVIAECEKAVVTEGTFTHADAYQSFSSWIASGDVTMPGRAAARHWTCTATRQAGTWTVSAHIAEDPASPSLSPSPSPSRPLTFATALDVIAALNARGLPCGKAVIVPDATVPVSLARCDGGIYVATFANHDQAEEELARLNSIGPGLHVHLAVGWNWTVNADALYAQRVAAVFGVEYQTT